MSVKQFWCPWNILRCIIRNLPPIPFRYFCAEPEKVKIKILRYYFFYFIFLYLNIEAIFANYFHFKLQHKRRVKTSRYLKLHIVISTKRDGSIQEACTYINGFEANDYFCSTFFDGLQIKNSYDQNTGDSCPYGRKYYRWLWITVHSIFMRQVKLDFVTEITKATILAWDPMTLIFNLYLVKFMNSTEKLDSILVHIFV